MSDKPLAGLLTALAVAPICALCILGPAVVGGALAWGWAWFWDLGPLVAAGLAILAASGVLALLRRRRSAGVSAGGSGQGTGKDG